jgi:hypothetical protein
LIFKWESSKLKAIPGLATDIGISRTGEIWIIGKKRIGPNGYNIFKWCLMKKRWILYPGIGYRISVDRYGNPWVV